MADFVFQKHSNCFTNPNQSLKLCNSLLMWVLQDGWYNECDWKKVSSPAASYLVYFRVKDYVIITPHTRPHRKMANTSLSDTCCWFWVDSSLHTHHFVTSTQSWSHLRRPVHCHSARWPRRWGPPPPQCSNPHWPSAVPATSRPPPERRRTTW